MIVSQSASGTSQMVASVSVSEGVEGVFFILPKIIANRFSVEPLPYETRTLQTLGARILWRIVSP